MLTKNNFVKVICSFLITLLPVIPSIAFCSSGNGHYFTKKDCTICHLVAKNGGITKTKENFTYQCGLCHKEIISALCLHKIDTPFTGHKNVITALLPLSSSGEMTCNTCHDVHTAPHTPQAINTHYLRNAMCATDLCLLCHEESTLKHSGIFITAHLRPISPERSGTQEVDQLSRVCLSCHDGLIAKSELPGEISSNGGCSTAGKNVSHPVGVNYLEAINKRGEKNALRPLEEVNKNILFFENKISCGSCHDPYSAKKQKLRIDDDRSKLCLACHKMSKN